MINIAERLKVEAQVKSGGGDDAASSAQLAGAEIQADNQVAAYPATNLILDGGRYFVEIQKK